MKRWTMVLVALAAAWVLALPAAAAKKERMGERLFLFPSAPATFAANQPFHIAHGWILVPDWSDHDAVGKRYFTLEIDGRPVEPSFVERSSNGETLARSWVYNFPAGLPAGTYTFTATWSGACRSLAESGLYSGTCSKPNAVVVAIAPLTRTIQFTS